VRPARAKLTPNATSAIPLEIADAPKGQFHMNLRVAAKASTRGIVSGSRQIDSGELALAARRMAGGLAALGVGQGDCVAILMRNDISFLTASYGAIALGAFAVPVNWHFKADEVGYVLRDSGAKVLVAHADLFRAVEGAIPRGLAVLAIETPPEIITAYCIDPISAQVPDEIDEFFAWLAVQKPYDGPPPPPTLSMIYTSGTTGNPKGVKRQAMGPEAEKAMDAIRNLVFGMEPGCRTAVTGPLYHAAPNAFGLRAGKMAGRLVLMPRFEPEEMLQLIERERIDTLFMVPTMFVRLLKLPEAVRQKYDVSSLRHVVHAAAPCPAEIKRAMIDWWGPVIYEFYGSTESGPVTFVSSVEALKKPGTIGRVSPGAEVKILDDAGRQLPQGEIGEIYSRIAAYPDFTYHNLPEKRREIEKDGFITSGDVGYFDQDGYLFLCDRKRDMVISGGVNIYPAEIEAALLTMPCIADCAVFGVPDDEYGETLMAVIEPVNGERVDIAQIRAELTQKFANYKVPKTIELRADLPREDSGKIFKRRLRDPYWEGVRRRI
jgi:long-chain acyl-CoA synthetase